MGRLNQELGIVQGAGLLATSLLGTGIFVVPAVAADIAGRWSLLAWILLIVLVLPIAFTFALLGRRYPHAGGAAHIVGQAMSGRWEKVTAFLFLSAMPVAIPASLVMATGFWHSVFDLSLLAELAIQFTTLAIVLVLGLGGARLSGNVQVVIALLISVLVAMLWWGGQITLADTSVSQDARLPVATIFPALAVMFWCFVGIEAFTHMGEEFRRPERDFPIAVFLGVLLAGVVYWGCSVAVLKFGVFGDQGSNTTAIPVLITRLFGAEALWVAAGVGYLACFASINIYIQGFSRLLWSMADEGFFPGGRMQALAQLSERKVPQTALILVVMICGFSALMTMLMHLPLDNLIRYANGCFILVYLLSMFAGVILLKGWQRWLAILSSLLCLTVLWALSADAIYAVILAMLFLALVRKGRDRKTGVAGSP